MAYEGQPLPLKLCYANMKNLLKRPAMSYGHAGSEEQPSYMKMTFAASKSVSANSKVLQLSSMLGSLKHMKGNQETQLLALAARSEESLMRTGKEQKPQVSKRQKEIDNKIERLLIAYKHQDEVAHKKVIEMEKDKKQGKKNLMEKFGFSDDEEEDVVLTAAELKKKALALP